LFFLPKFERPDNFLNFLSPRLKVESSDTKNYFIILVTIRTGMCSGNPGRDILTKG